MEKVGHSINSEKISELSSLSSNSDNDDEENSKPSKRFPGEIKIKGSINSGKKVASGEILPYLAKWQSENNKRII